MNTTPDDLFHPSQLDVAGADLDTVIQSLEARGARVTGMHVVGISTYRLTITWPIEITAIITHETENP